MLRAQLHSFQHSPFSAVSLHTSIGGSYLFAKPLTTQCSAAILQLNFRILSQNCDWIFVLKPKTWNVVGDKFINHLTTLYSTAQKYVNQNIRTIRVYLYAYVHISIRVCAYTHMKQSKANLPQSLFHHVYRGFSFTLK